MYIYIYIYIFMYPIGSMYGIYGNIYHQYTPFMLAYIPAPWILWDIFPFCWMMWKIMTFTKPKHFLIFFREWIPSPLHRKTTSSPRKQLFNRKFTWIYTYLGTHITRCYTVILLYIRFVGVNCFSFNPNFGLGGFHTGTWDYQLVCAGQLQFHQMRMPDYQWHSDTTLWLFNIAMENPHF